MFEFISFVCAPGGAWAKMKPKSLTGNLVKDVFRLQASRLSVKMGGIFYKTIKTKRNDE